MFNKLHSSVHYLSRWKQNTPSPEATATRLLPFDDDDKPLHDRLFAFARQTHDVPRRRV